MDVLEPQQSPVRTLRPVFAFAAIVVVVFALFVSLFPLGAGRLLSLRSDRSPEILLSHFCVVCINPLILLQGFQKLGPLLKLLLEHLSLFFVGDKLFLNFLFFCPDFFLERPHLVLNLEIHKNWNTRVALNIAVEIGVREAQFCTSRGALVRFRQRIDSGALFSSAGNWRKFIEGNRRKNFVLLVLNY